MENNNQSNRSIQDLVDDAFYAQIQTNVNLDYDQLNALQNLSEYSVQCAIESPEVIKKPLKVIYKANEALTKALVAICLAQALINPRRNVRENKQFFEHNITVTQKENRIKIIDFGNIRPENVQAAIYWDIIEDWKLYFDKNYGGIRSLVDEKTNLVGLPGYRAGGDPMYEFARFHRKFTEKERGIEEETKIAVKRAFQEGVAQTVAIEATKQQLLEGKNPMDIINSLLGNEDKTPNRIANNQRKSPQISHKPNKPQLTFKKKGED